ncbi:MAG: TIGR02391 family protein [Chloroflexota bacterium]
MQRLYAVGKLRALGPQLSLGVSLTKEQLMGRKDREPKADMDPAVIQYAGEPGVSSSCQEAVIRFLQCGHVTSARILTCRGSHALLLKIDADELVVIKSGFSSGYGGEGPRTFSYVLQLLEAHDVEIEEHEISAEMLDRIEYSALARADMDEIERSRPIRPTRWWEYVWEIHEEWRKNGLLWRNFPAIIPYSLIDPRIMDLALSFWTAPDERLMTAYRRLEDIVRQRIGIDEHGVKLFQAAFLGAEAKLRWPVPDSGEQAGRANLFIGAFGAFRNPRAHREPNDDAERLVSEFLLVNQLFRLEREASPRGES